MADLRCSKCLSYLFNSPVQCSCGDRLCGDCYNDFKSRYGKALIHVHPMGWSGKLTRAVDASSIWLYIEHVVRKQPLLAQNVRRKYHWKSASRTKPLRMSSSPPLSSVPTRIAPGRGLEDFIWYEHSLGLLYIDVWWRILTCLLLLLLYVYHQNCDRIL